MRTHNQLTNRMVRPTRLGACTLPITLIIITKTTVTTTTTGDFRAPDDPPELEFYRIRPFTIGSSKRLAAHVLIYVPSPSDVVVMPGYGRQPLWYCKGGCCHGPHMVLLSH